MNIQADVAVVGAGPAGIAAAIAAAERGRRVVIVDQGVTAGGQIWRHRSVETPPPAAAPHFHKLRALRVQHVAGATVIDAPSPNALIVETGEQCITVAAGAVVIATGARERMMPFPGWTLPGVFGVGGIQALLKSGLDVSGRRVVLAGSGPLLFPVAASLRHAGARVLLIGEQARGRAVVRFGFHALRDGARLGAAIRYRAALAGIRYGTSTWVRRVASVGGELEVELQVGRKVRVLRSDWVAAAAGLVASTDLARVIGARVASQGVAVDATQRTSVRGVWAAGECTGVKGDAAAIAEGTIAGCDAAGDIASASAPAMQRARAAGLRLGVHLRRAFAVRRELRAVADAATIICRCEDVRREMLDPAWSYRQAKLWTRLGMGACQGAVCGPACAELFGWEENTVRAPLGAPTCSAWMRGLRA